MGGEEDWCGDFDPGPGLRIAACSALPPPSVGSACILEGTIPEPMGKESGVASISFMLEGSPVVELIDGSKCVRLQVMPGTFGIAPVDSSCLYRTEGFHKSLNLAIADQSIQRFAREELGSGEQRVELIACLDAEEPHELVQLGSAFARLLKRPKKGSALYAQTLWTQILLQLLWHCSTLSLELDTSVPAWLSEERIHAVQEFMEATLSQDISLSDLADHVGLSPSYFVRSFKKATGQTPIQFRKNLRMARAAELLRETVIPVSEIAQVMGFPSHSLFCAAFRRHHGTSPSAYRRTSR